MGEDFEYDVGAQRSNKHFSVQGVRIASLATSYTAASASMPPSLRIAIRYAEPLAAPAAAGLLALGLVGLASLALRRRTPVWLSAPGVSVLSFTLVALPYTAHAATLTSGPGTYGRHGEPILAYLVDHLGTIRGAVNQAGTIVETRDYAPFGESIAHTGAFAVQHRFTGQPQDDQAGGLYDYGARFYNPKWGRFVSPDEVVQGFDSQGLNPFTYVLNRPTGATDPTGNYILNGFRVDSTWKQEANEARSAEYAIARDAAHKRGSATGWTPPAPASSSSHAFAMAGAFSFAPTGGATLTPSEYVMEVARGEFLDVVGGLSGTAGGLAGGFVQALNGILTWSPDTAFEGLLDTLAALVMPRLGRDGGLRYGGDGPTIPASNTRVQKASKWHDDFVAWNGYWNASAQFGWIERAWTGPGVEPGPYGQAYRILGTVGFGIAGALQKIIPF